MAKDFVLLKTLTILVRSGLRKNSSPNNKIKLEKIVQKMCHNPAILYEIEKRGFIKEGYYADIVIFSPNNPWTVNKGNILYKCGWSPFEGNTFRSRISHTIVNGNIVYNNDKIFDNKLGKKLIFNR